jgi:hypothetical protein
VNELKLHGKSGNKGKIKVIKERKDKEIKMKSQKMYRSRAATTQVCYGKYRKVKAI